MTYLVAIHDINPEEEDFSSSGLEAFKRAARDQVMPKGSFIGYEFGYNKKAIGSLTFWKIYIYVELDKHPLNEKFDEKNRVPANKHLVRKQYISIAQAESVK